MKITSNKFFFVIQALFKYLAFESIINLRELSYRPFFNTMGKNISFLDNVTIKYPDEISLGNNVRFNEGTYIVGNGGLNIGNNVMIGSGTKIATTSHHTEKPDVPMDSQGMYSKSITIGNDVWFGFNAIVLGGVTIGDGCIIAAGAVLMEGDYPSFSVIAGIPARPIKSRLD